MLTFLHNFCALLQTKQASILYAFDEKASLVHSLCTRPNAVICNKSLKILHNIEPGIFFEEIYLKQTIRDTYININKNSFIILALSSCYATFIYGGSRKSGSSGYVHCRGLERTGLVWSPGSIQCRGNEGGECEAEKHSGKQFSKMKETRVHFNLVIKAWTLEEYRDAKSG